MTTDEAIQRARDAVLESYARWEDLRYEGKGLAAAKQQDAALDRYGALMRAAGDARARVRADPRRPQPPGLSAMTSSIEDARAAVLNRASLYADAWRRRRGADSDEAWERFRDEVDRLIAAVREETLRGD